MLQCPLEKLAIFQQLELVWSNFNQMMNLKIVTEYSNFWIIKEKACITEVSAVVSAAEMYTVGSDNQVWIYCFWSWFLGAATFCTRCMASWYRERERAIYIIIILMLRLYNCSAIYIVKYSHSIAFGNIYIGAHFLCSREGEKLQKTAECRTSRRLSMFWTSRCVHRMSTSPMSTTALDKGQEHPCPWKTHPYCLRRVQLQSSQHCREQ